MHRRGRLKLAILMHDLFYYYSKVPPTMHRRGRLLVQYRLSIRFVFVNTVPKTVAVTLDISGTPSVGIETFSSCMVVAL
ncbi:hypothetical protein CEXT_490121 [Caerostris extrusa]|uniref:Uncharacterized protein n=1 Tax=Caerostris extrusa TaxID=172846 RepID=A0AAV4WXA6_CAEEX|nr:hypothetical protein CEXT_490121 [Caerostris extrusa]